MGQDLKQLVRDTERLDRFYASRKYNPRFHIHDEYDYEGPINDE